MTHFKVLCEQLTGSGKEVKWCHRDWGLVPNQIADLIVFNELCAMGIS